MAWKARKDQCPSCGGLISCYDCGRRYNRDTTSEGRWKLKSLVDRYRKDSRSEYAQAIVDYIINNLQSLGLEG